MALSSQRGNITSYNVDADRDSWAAMLKLFDEIYHRPSAHVNDPASGLAGLTALATGLVR